MSGDKLPIVEADRDAVLRYWNDGPMFYGTDAHVASVEDDHPLVQAFARHRVAAETKAATTITELVSALEPFAEAWDVATHHKEIVSRLTMGQLGELAAHEISGVHFRNARTALSNTRGDKNEQE